MKTRDTVVLFALALSTPSLLLQAQPRKATEAKITVQVDRPGHPISPTLFGAFFEDINLSADGGFYLSSRNLLRGRGHAAELTSP
jgi:hypothetical protein